MPRSRSIQATTTDGARAAGAVGSIVVVAAPLLAIALLPLTGCQKSLFPENQPRTQFEAYEIMRQRYVPLEEPDVFGTPRPAVRARLTPER